MISHTSTECPQLNKFIQKNILIRTKKEQQTLERVMFAMQISLVIISLYCKLF